MLQALGLKSTLITDGRTPINLLNTASGLLGPMPQVSLSIQDFQVPNLRLVYQFRTSRPPTSGQFIKLELLGPMPQISLSRQLTSRPPTSGQFINLELLCHMPQVSLSIDLTSRFPTSGQFIKSGLLGPQPQVSLSSQDFQSPNLRVVYLIRSSSPSPYKPPPILPFSSTSVPTHLPLFPNSLNNKLDNPIIVSLN